MVLGLLSMGFSGVMALSQKNGMETKSKYVRKEPCPECGSKDNLAIYDDGHGYCFGCGYTQQPQKDKPRKSFVKSVKKPLLKFENGKVIISLLFEFFRIMMILNMHDKKNKGYSKHCK